MNVTDFHNQYFMKFCHETQSKNCCESQCQYRIFCSRYTYLKIKETNKNNQKKG